MINLKKNIGNTEYAVYGPNAVILSWARESELGRRIFGDTGMNEDILFQALGSTNPEKTNISAKQAIQSLWHAFPELGPYPFLDTLSDMEFGRQFYTEYREHVVHQLRVFLTGIYLFDLCEPLKSRILNEINAQDEAVGEAEFVRRWTACAIYHDIGYVLENEQGNNPTGDAWIKTRDAMNRTLSSPLASLRYFKDSIPEHVERKINIDNKIWRLEIAYPDGIEYDGGKDMFEFVSDFGLKSGLGNTVAPNKSPLRKYYEYAFSTDPDGRSRFRDHGIVSALLLLRIWNYYRDYLNVFITFRNDPNLKKAARNIETVHSRMPACESAIVAAAGAIALHNITPPLWDRGHALTHSLTLHDFSIRLTDNNIVEPAGSTPLAFLLGLADTLQDWDRPRFRAMRETDRPGLDQQDMCFYADDKKIFLFYETDINFTTPETYLDSRFLKTKNQLKSYLEPEAVDALLECGKCENPKEDEPDQIVYVIASKADSEHAERLYDDLKRLGLNPWMESRDLKAGSNIKAIVEKYINSSAYVLALLSSNAWSKRGFLHKELSVALDVFDECPPDEIFIIPVRLDNCDISEPNLRKLKAVDLYKSYAEGMKQILRVVAPDKQWNAKDFVREKDNTAKKHAGNSGRDSQGSLVTHETRIGNVTGQVHTGSGDILVGNLPAGNQPAKQTLLTDFRILKTELETAKRQGLSEDTFEDTLIEIEAAEREAGKPNPQSDRILKRLNNAKAFVSSASGMKPADKLASKIQTAIETVESMK